MHPATPVTEIRYEGGNYVSGIDMSKSDLSFPVAQ